MQRSTELQPRSRDPRDFPPRLAELDCQPATGPEGVRLTSLTLDVTHRCSHRCLDCIEGYPMACSRHADLDPLTVCLLIKQFAAGGGREVSLYGGEPTLYAHLPTIIGYAAERVGRIRLVTNGTYLGRPDIIDALRAASERAGVEVSVRVSLNAATAATHTNLHRVSGYFHQVVQGLALVAERAPRVGLGVSFLVKDENVSEIVDAYRIAGEAGATSFWVRPRTGAHGVGLVPLGARTRRLALAAIEELTGLASPTAPAMQVEPWYVQYLRAEALPEIAKPYPTCFYCAASRIVVTPPDPGIAWACPYWRADPRFLVARLGEHPLGTPQFESRRIEAIRRIHPPRDCAQVICNRNEENKAAWTGLTVERSCEAEPVALWG